MRGARLDALEIETEVLQGKKLAVVGAGATGSRMLEQLARMGTDLIILDRDVLEESNLATSALYTERQVEQGLPKAVAAAERLQGIHTGITIDADVADLNRRTAERLLGSADIVLDGTDNMEARFLINEYCAKKLLPWIHVSALATSGEVMPVVPGTTPCFNCVFGDVDGSKLETCETAGILPAAAATAASLGVAEAVRVLNGETREGLTRFDVAQGHLEQLQVEQRENCGVCSGDSFPLLEGEEGTSTVSVCGEDSYHVDPGKSVDLDMLASKLQDIGDVEVNPYLLQFSGDEEFAVFRDGRMLVEADSPEKARSVYSRFVGV